MTCCISRRYEVLEDKLPHAASECFQKRDGCPFPLCEGVKRSDSNLIFLVAPTVKNMCVPEQNHFNLKLRGGLFLSNISILLSCGLQALQLQSENYACFCTRKLGLKINASSTCFTKFLAPEDRFAELNPDSGIQQKEAEAKGGCWAPLETLAIAHGQSKGKEQRGLRGERRAAV